VSLVVLVPDVDMAVPERVPTTTQAGNLSLKKLTQRDREDYYKLYVRGQVLVTVREAFAVAPGLRSARIVVLRNDGPDTNGRAKISCLLATKLDRSSLAGLQWATASAAEILNSASSDTVHNPRGRSQGLSPIDLVGEPELAELVAAVDLNQLVGGDPEPAGSPPGLIGQGNAGASAHFAGGPGVVAANFGGLPSYSANASNPPAPPVQLKRSNAKAILLGLGIPALLCCGIGTVFAAVNASNNTAPTPAPVHATTPRLTATPATSAPDNSAPVSAVPLPTPTRTTEVVPPAPPPPPPAPKTTTTPPPQTGVHPGAFCSPHYAFGYTSGGVLMQCKPSTTDTAFRWRAA
jgi:hypothetical protein